MTDQTNYVVVGLGFGDEGKGATVDAICACTGIDTVVRWSGGCQAAHNVVTEDGRHHTFSQFGSGTFRGANTVLAAPMMIEPFSLLREAEALYGHGFKDILDRIVIDGDCLVTTPYHKLVNRQQERARGVHAHGSCGRGIGETRRMLFVHSAAVSTKALSNVNWTTSNLRYLADKYRFEGYDLSEFPDPEELAYQYLEFSRLVDILPGEEIGAIIQRQPVVFEGSQGILLDETWGFHPHTTWSDVTPRLPTILKADPTIIGCVRSYTTRHGHGPFPTEDPTLDKPEPHNGTGVFQGAWRVGHFDVSLHAYAVNVVRRFLSGTGWNQLRLMVNHWDQSEGVVLARSMNKPWAEYPLHHSAPSLGHSEARGKQLQRKANVNAHPPVTLNEIARELGVQVGGYSTGPTASDRVFF